MSGLTGVAASARGGYHLEVLRKETSDLEQKQSQAQAELDRLIEALALDVTI